MTTWLSTGDVLAPLTSPPVLHRPAHPAGSIQYFCHLGYRIIVLLCSGICLFTILTSSQVMHETRTRAGKQLKKGVLIPLKWNALNLEEGQIQEDDNAFFFSEFFFFFFTNKNSMWVSQPPSCSLPPLQLYYHVSVAFTRLLTASLHPLSLSDAIRFIMWQLHFY